MWEMNLLALLALLSYSASAVPTISRVSPALFVSSGGAVSMDCEVLHATEYPVLWVKLPKGGGKDMPTPLTSGSALIVRDDRFSLRYDTATSTFTLQIEDVRPSDEATYQCQVIVDIGSKVTRQVNLTVLSPPTIKATPPRVRAREGSEAELRCRAEGEPTPNITWTREGRRVGRGEAFRLAKVRRGHRGEYECKADNGAGMQDDDKVLLEVEFKPRALIAGRERVGQKLGRKVRVACAVEAFPMSKEIVWMRRGERIGEVSDKGTYSVEAGYVQREDVAESRLTIQNLTQKQLGKYSCHASNSLGSSVATVEVFELESANCQAEGGICGQGLTAEAKAGRGNIANTFVVAVSMVLLLSARLQC